MTSFNMECKMQAVQIQTCGRSCRSNIQNAMAKVLAADSCILSWRLSGMTSFNMECKMQAVQIQTLPISNEYNRFDVLSGSWVNL